jgi:hypothetical protein
LVTEVALRGKRCVQTGEVAGPGQAAVVAGSRINREVKEAHGRKRVRIAKRRPVDVGNLYPTVVMIDANLNAG